MAGPSGAGGVGQWTRRFAMGSAASMGVLQAVLLLGVPIRKAAVIGVFGVVLPMTFGMAYLLFPSYLGRTLPGRTLPGVHFGLAFFGAALLSGKLVFEFGESTYTARVISWSVGVIVFVGALLRTAVPVIAPDPVSVLRSDSGPRRSTRLVTIAIPVAVGYLIVGTLALLLTLPASPDLIGATLPMAIHFYAAGFATLLIIALGVRLLGGFFHVTPPPALSGVVLLAGTVAPGILSSYFLRTPWFDLGAGLLCLAAAGYAALVSLVALRTNRWRTGLYGIWAGSLLGLAGVCVAAAGTTGLTSIPFVAVHVPLVLNGFLLLTIAGYAYLFFPVATGQFRGATEQVGKMTLVSFGSGVVGQAVGAWAGLRWLQTGGDSLALLGTAGYTYLLIRRLRE